MTLVPPLCYRCVFGRIHAFHDDGTVTDMIWMWQPGGPYAAPHHIDGELWNDPGR